VSRVTCTKRYHKLVIRYTVHKILTGRDSSLEEQIVADSISRRRDSKDLVELSV
jgi:hypothetical protein